MPSSAFVTGTIPITTTAGSTTNIKVAVMPDGGVVVAHAFVDATDAMLDPAKDATVQAATAAILAATAAFSTAS